MSLSEPSNTKGKEWRFHRGVKDFTLVNASRQRRIQPTSSCGLTRPNLWMRDTREVRRELPRCASVRACIPAVKRALCRNDPSGDVKSCTRLVVRAAHVVLNGSFLFTELLSFLLRPTEIPPRTGGREGILYPEDVLPKKLSRPKPSCSLAIRVKGLGFVLFFCFSLYSIPQNKSRCFPNMTKNSHFCCTPTCIFKCYNDAI